jgi:multimeric flavodoxin WrbA|tara:strand:+ start:333 stop:797 length:465 start_codon:yes stop_codon:yes gene_type:complete
MKSKTILFINHSPSNNTLKLTNHIQNKVKDFNPKIKLITLNPNNTFVSSFDLVDAVIIGTVENFGYMSGMTKDFFDRCYDDLKDKTQGLPIFYYVRAGLDGEGSQIAINKILIGLKWRQVLPPLILNGEWSDNFIDLLEEKTLTFISGVEMGIY